ncbi:MAG: hypothetical protein U9Q76_09510, partial [candidate division WOR-3 bacterium]|nr:hypothetical protein [candidate division WOR-3 bacterium]
MRQIVHDSPVIPGILVETAEKIVEVHDTIAITILTMSRSGVDELVVQSLNPNLTDSNTRGILGASGYQMHMWNGVSDAKVEDPPRTRDRMD